VITEKHLREGLREVKLALLEADVNYKVVKDFLGRVEEKAVGIDRIRGVSPGHHVVKIVHEELTGILGDSHRGIAFADEPPTIVLLAGLQGSGKTTSAAKLARFLQGRGKRPFLIAADIYRPAAVDQLRLLAERADVPVHAGAEGESVPDVVAGGVKAARAAGADVVIIDSAGRLHCDAEMIAELRAVEAAFRPHETLLVIDGMTGQDAVTIAETFHGEIGLSGVILTKMEGDARGGAALSIFGVTGCPIKFIGVGEGLDDLEPFHPDRMASRILARGDIVTLVEKARAAVGEEELRRVEEKVRKRGEFDLDDFLASLRQLQGMGPLDQLLDMIPGLRSIRGAGLDMDRGQISRVEAIILSMTPEERARPDLMNGSRRMRVARGSGTTVQEVNRLLNQFKSMKKMFRQSGRKMKGAFGRKEIRLWQ
jgi:signal recognition particle subunit SRP54